MDDVKGHKQKSFIHEVYVFGQSSGPSSWFQLDDMIFNFNDIENCIPWCIQFIHICVHVIGVVERDGRK